MSAILDRLEELSRMKEQGERCMHVARERQDREGFVKWQRCVTHIDRMLSSMKTSPGA